MVEVWASGDSYESYVGRWSRLVAREFLSWLAIPANSRWLDVGCGTGALCQSILQQAAPREVTGIDRSEAYVAFAQQQLQDERARFQISDAQDLAVDTAACDAVVSGLALNFIPDPRQAVSEMARVTRPGG
ncbi:MAG: class I SAM-dependent methyltransferase, partial [Chloroflexi bacterium]|nr:class I SAM-dependent methyltransferase [Chloroflexota bacterium]